MPPMEVDAAYHGCLSSCELHSRSLAVGRTVTCGSCAQSRDCAYALRNPEIAHTCYTIPRLPVQSRDSENAQHNLEIARIPRLHGTYACITCISVRQLSAQGRRMREADICFSYPPLHVTKDLIVIR